MIYLLENDLLSVQEASLKRSCILNDAEFYRDKYRKMRYESDRHFLCRAILQEELKNLGISTTAGFDVGDMNILRTDCSYDIITDDFSWIIDIGLTPARNYFKGLTDGRVQKYFITPFFDDYMDDILFSVFEKNDSNKFYDAVMEYEERFKY